jgi:hypothetical protein
MITAALWSAQLTPVFQKPPFILSGRHEICCEMTTKPATLAATQTIIVSRSRYVHTPCKNFFCRRNPWTLLYCHASRLCKTTSGTVKRDCALHNQNRFISMKGRARGLTAMRIRTKLGSILESTCRLTNRYITSTHSMSDSSNKTYSETNMTTLVHDPRL